MTKILTCIIRNATFNGSYFRLAFFPKKNAPIATAMNAITTAAIISSVGSDEVGCCDCEVEGDELGDVFDVGVDAEAL